MNPDILPACAELTDSGGAIAPTDTGLVLAPPLAIQSTALLQPITDLGEYLRARKPVAHFKDELQLWTRLPSAIASEVRALLDAFDLVNGYRAKRWSVTKACAKALTWFSTWNWKLKSFRYKYDAWVRTRDWFVLVNRSKAGVEFQHTEATPAELPGFVNDRLAAFSGKGAKHRALASIVTQWRTGRNHLGKEETIAGYAKNWETRNRHLPPWTEATLARVAKSRARAREVFHPDFIQFWQMLCERHQRTTAAAWRQLVHEIWKPRLPFEIGGVAYDCIPGYTNWPEADPTTDLPAGWSEANLNRYTPDEYELAAARIGIQKASALGFKIRTSRFGLRLGEFMEFDDHEFNVKVNFPGQLRAMRPRCFGAVDALTDCMFSLVIKPTLWDMENDAKRVLTENDFMWFIISVLTHRGYRADVGTMLLIEWGVSAIRGNKKLRINDPLRDDLEKRIYDATGGMVRVDRGGRFHHKANPSQFAPPSGGNFRFKPHVEQFWRMLDDWLDALKGQVGKDRNHAPEEMERADAYNNKLLKVARAMGVEQASRFILNRMTFAEFTQVAHTVRSLINDDREHECNSWEQCGFVLKEWRPTTALDWNPLALLASQPAEVQQAVQQNDLLFRARRMSRNEADRFCAQREPLTVLPMMMIPHLVGEQHGGKPVTVRHGKFEFSDWRIGADPLVFVAQDASGMPLREGEKFVPYCNPMSPDCLVITDARGSVVSVCPPDLQPARNDEHGTKAAMGFKNQWQANKLAPQRARHAAAGAGVEFMKAHNEAVQNCTTPEDVERQEETKQQRRSAWSAAAAVE